MQLFSCRPGERRRGLKQRNVNKILNAWLTILIKTPKKTNQYYFHYERLFNPDKVKKNRILRGSKSATGEGREWGGNSRALKIPETKVFLF